MRIAAHIFCIIIGVLAFGAWMSNGFNQTTAAVLFAGFVVSLAVLSLHDKKS